MTFMPCRPLPAALCALAGLLVALPAPATAQSQRYSPPPKPRLAWLGSPRPTFERSTQPEDYGVAVRPRIWQGFHAGLAAGYAWGSADPVARYDSVNLDSPHLAGYAGYTWQHGTAVLGVEADLGWRRGEGARTFEMTDRLTASAGLMASARLRAGVAVDNLLLYATGGLALGSFEADLATPSGMFSASGTHTGWVAGAGIEMRFTDTISGRLEALHYGFDDRTFEFSSAPMTMDLSTTTVRAGITWHFK